MKRLVAACLACTGCSLVFPMSEYDEGAGSGSGGGGGALDCGTFANPRISELQSTFDAGLGPDLEFLNACGAVVDGKVVFEPAITEYCWFYNVSERRLTCDALTIRLVDIGSQQNGMQRFIYLNDVGTDQRVSYLQEVNGFGFESLDELDETFDPIDDAWWRLRADLDLLYFETSPDGSNWTLKASGPPPFSLDAVRVQIGAGIWQEIASPAPVSYDCLNVPPPCP